MFTSPQTTNAPAQKDEDLAIENPPHDNEFISDSFANSTIDDEDLRKEMQQLSVKTNEASNAGKPFCVFCHLIYLWRSRDSAALTSWTLSRFLSSFEHFLDS